MKNILITILLIIQIPFLLIAQNDETIEIQIDEIDSTSNSEIQIFNEKFNTWVKSIDDESLKPNLNVKRMVNNFIIFSEDGLIMKDLDFHSVKSCKEQILMNLPNSKVDNDENNWIYVAMESQINKSELIEILTFLKEKNIDYQFEREDEFVMKIIKK